jgi:SAM-dependent methyltransferase
MAIDQPKLDEFLGRLVADLGAVFAAPAVVAGDRLGLYKALAAAGPSTPAELAERSGTHPRDVAEWLAGQAAGGYVTYDPAADRYLLTEEQGFALADETSPAFVPGAFQVATSAAKDEPRVTEAIRSGEGLGWHQHHADLWQGTERFLRPGYAANLVESWIPALDGVEGKLRAGARVADVGCGHGASTILLAQAYPGSSFVGFDDHDRSIEWARKAAADAGVSDRVSFEVAPADAYPGQGYDLVAVFDALHDMGDPLAAAAHVRRSLAPGGTFLLVEPAAGERVTDNLNPVGRIFYSASLFICVPSARSQGGEGLGSQVPQATWRELLTRPASAGSAAPPRPRSTGCSRPARSEPLRPRSPGAGQLRHLERPARRHSSRPARTARSATSPARRSSWGPPPAMRCFLALKPRTQRQAAQQAWRSAGVQGRPRACSLASRNSPVCSTVAASPGPPTAGQTAAATRSSQAGPGSCGCAAPR